MTHFFYGGDNAITVTVIVVIDSVNANLEYYLAPRNFYC